jgi:Tfp pilus assembly protein FimT
MHNERRKKKIKGFSLFEIIITLGILLIITTVVFPVAVNKAGRSKLESYANQIVTDLYFQQQRSSNKNIDQGILIQSNRYILFDGVSYATSSESDVKNLPANMQISSITLTGGTEIQFEKGSFKPTTYGSFILSDGVFSFRVYINREGLISYEEV